MTETATLRTRKTTISARKVALEGEPYLKTWIGLPVVYTTYDGERLLGVIDRWEGLYPIVTFDDGRWARGDYSVEIVEHDLSAWNCDEPFDGMTYADRSCPTCAR